MKENPKKLLVAAFVVAALIAFFFIAKNLDPNYFKELGLGMSLPLFTFLIAIIDGFNPCTMWVLTFLLVLLFSVSDSRKRIFAVGYTFVAVVFIIYFMFMAAWLNIFMYIGYVDIVRVVIAIVALAAGAINCKDYFFFREGITLMIQEQHKKPLVEKLNAMKGLIKRGSMPALIGASVILALFASLVELPCTAGWPIIYTKILADRVLENTFCYYCHILLYCLIYIIPLSVIIFSFGYFFKGKQISKDQMRLIKLIGGVIMIALGIVLLVNPSLLFLS
jgi:cytochrome c biogenesis protein CcdA